MPTGKEAGTTAEFATVASKFGWAFGVDGEVLLDPDSDLVVMLEPRNKNQPPTHAAKTSAPTISARRLIIDVCLSMVFVFTALPQISDLARGLSVLVRVGSCDARGSSLVFWTKGGASHELNTKLITTEIDF